VGLAALGVPTAQAALDQSDEVNVASNGATYGGDPGRDEIMFTLDDLCYLDVINSAAKRDISFLTVDYTGSGVAQQNFQTIAGLTGGVYYSRPATPNWNSSVLADIVARIGSGKGDVVFVFDLSGSMGGAILSDVKNKTKWIVDNLPAGMDVAFGIGSHVDYPHSYNSCAYAVTYGTAATGDYAWNFDQQITSDRTATKNEVDTLVTYYGGDTPEDYVRAVFETQFFMWRFQAKRIVVMYGDAPAHSCCTGPVGGTVMPLTALELLGPYLGLASMSAAAAVAGAVYVGYRRRKNE
jgi:hypothetical protein